MLTEQKMKELAASNYDYFLIEPSDGTNLCSDKLCPCTDQRRLGKENIYLIITPDLVEFRKDCQTIQEASQKVQLFQMKGISIDPSLYIPIACCSTAIKNRGLDKDIAHADALYWYDTGKVPLRATPKVGESNPKSATLEKNSDISLVNDFMSILGVGMPSQNKATPQIEQLAETLTDIDGNVYHTIKIGKQIWTVENFKATKYNDGTAIRVEGEEEYIAGEEEYVYRFLGIFPVKKMRPIIKTRKTPNINDKLWSELKDGAMCWYGNSFSNKDTYGGLYNWHAVNTGKLAPKGWHVPTDAEWSELEEYLIANGYNWDGSKVGNKIAKALAAKTAWGSSSTAGAIGNDLSKNNASGFSALPGGSRYGGGSFYPQSYGGHWWSATEYDASNAWYRTLDYGGESLGRHDYYELCGFSLRLVRDVDY